MKNILKIIQVSRLLHKYFFMISILILLSAILQMATPLLSKLVVDEIEMHLKTGAGSLEYLYQLIIYMLIAGTFGIIVDSTTQRMGDFTASRLKMFLTERFYAKIFTLSQKYFDNEVSGKITNQLSRGISTIQDFINASTNFILPAFLQTIFTIGILFYFDKLVAFLVFLLFPFYMIISSYSTKRWGKEEVKKNEIDDLSRGRIQEVISNIKLVKGFNTQKYEWNFVSENLKKSVGIYDKQSNSYHILNFFRNFGLEIVLIIISIIVFKNTFTGEYKLSEMVLVLQMLNLVRRPLYAMSFILERMQQAENGSAEYFEILNLESTEVFDSSTKMEKFSNPEIEFKNVNFSYNEKSEVLSNISFKIGSREKVALVGHSGAGKTTVINMIMKFYDATQGDIFISGKNYSDLDHSTIRNNISLVFQESELFSATVRENVAYGISDPDESSIIDALKKANAYDFVMKLPENLDSQVGERGVKLSGGQKQRIQIARAIMRNAPILILDEATSSLDSKSERLVQEALENLMRDKLVLLIAHRFSTIQDVDRILVLQDGAIVDSGTPQELANREGIYSELLKYQMEGNKKLLSQYELY